MNRSRLILSGIAVLALAGGVANWTRSGKSPGPSASAHPKSPIPIPQSLPLHPVVARIVKDGPTMPYLKFNYLIKELPTDLAAHDIEALIAFIMAPRPPAFQDAEWGSLTNDIQEALSVQTVPSQKVCEALIATYRDESRIQLMRDYALQHIGGFAIYLVHTRSVREDTLPPFFGDLTGELNSAATQTFKPWSGTALNLLDGLLRAAEYRSVEVPGLNGESLVALALPIARDPSAPLNARLPALQVAARHDSPAARDLAREILSSPEPGLMLVQSASAALARLGTADDLPLLRSVSANATRHTAPALNEAIRSIQTRSHSE